MKRLRAVQSLAGSALALVLVLVAGCGDEGGGGPAASIRVTSPDGDEEWIGTYEVTLTWESSAYAGNVDVEYSTNGGTTWTTLAADTEDDGSVTVNAPNVDAPVALVQVSAADGDPAAATAPSDRSDAAFTILPAFRELASLTGVCLCSLAWGDCDSDGDLDLAVAGWDASPNRITKVCRNDGAGAFTEIVNPSLTGVLSCALAWGDADNDGDLDLAIAGDSDSGHITTVYENDGAGAFTEIVNPGLTGVSRCSLAWGDCDNDGDLDLAVAGRDAAGAKHTKVYGNDGAGGFTQMASLEGVEYCSLAWGDCDNDGDLDLGLAGEDVGETAVTKVYQNDGAGALTEIVNPGLTGLVNCSLAWGDCDNDGDLDLAVAGETEFSCITTVYVNNCPVANAPPEAPTGLVAFPGATDTLLVWEEAIDPETPAEGLSYNLRVRDIVNTAEVFPAMAKPDGQRDVPAFGPVPWNPSFPFWELKLPSGAYFFEVQAIDSALEGGAWSEPGLFSVP